MKIKFIIFSILFIFISLLLVFTSCEDSNNSSGIDPVKTGKVTFFNESSYKVIIHRDSFNGVILLELPANGPKQTIDVRTTDNYGVGTTFSIEYLYNITDITDAFDTESGEVIASGIDPNVQINRVIEENKSYTIQIPQPKNLEFKSAFITILNTYNLPVELRYLGTVFKQTGNGNISIIPGKTGVYKLERIPTDGKLYQNYELVSTFANTTISDFTVKNGFIYSFTYIGSSVEGPKEQPIIFK